MPGRIAVLCGMLLILSACFRQQLPADEPPSPPSSSVVSENEPSSWVIVLEGYENSDFRRVFQEQLSTQGLAVELLNAGAGHAEYQIMLTPFVQPNWRQNLLQFLGERYLLQQEGERLLFIRQ